MPYCVIFFFQEYSELCLFFVRGCTLFLLIHWFSLNVYNKAVWLVEIVLLLLKTWWFSLCYGESRKVRIQKFAEFLPRNHPLSDILHHSKSSSLIIFWELEISISWIELELSDVHRWCAFREKVIEISAGSNLQWLNSNWGWMWDFFGIISVVFSSRVSRFWLKHCLFMHIIWSLQMIVSGMLILGGPPDSSHSQKPWLAMPEWWKWNKSVFLG